MNTLDFVDLLQEFNELQTGWPEERMPNTTWTNAGKLDESQTGHQAPEPQATVEERNKQPHQEGLMNNDPNGPHQQQQVLFQLLDNIDPQQTFSQGTESTVQQVNTDPNGSTQQHAEPLQVQDTGDLTAIVHQELHNMDQQIPNSYSAPEDNNGKNYQSEIEGEPQQSQQELLGNNDPYLWHDISQTIQQDLESTTQQPQQEQPRETDPNRIQQQPLNNDDLEDLGDLSNYLAQINQNQSKMAETITPQNVKERYEIEFTIDAKPIIIKLNLNKASRWCRVCDKTFNRVGHLKEHQYRIHAIPHKSKRRCRLCNKIYPTQKKAEKHQIKCKEARNYKPYLCTICNITFHAYVQARKHEREIHPPKMTIACNDPGYTFETIHLPMLIEHKKQTHAHITKCTEPGCTYKTKYNNISRHRRTVHAKPTQNKQHECTEPQCEYKTNDKSNFKRHLKSHKHV